ncbi:MAG TPA: hypothetical protein VJT13_16400 [Xanthobacteraceae bacterium]|nr:hypothetical protein [Xanthobacteraceae bacterium]
MDPRGSDPVYRQVNGTSAMNQDLPNDVPGSASGMSAFFSSTNLRRYRSLMDDKINIGERVRVLDALAEEWDASTRECRMAGIAHTDSRTSFAQSEIQGDASGKRNC